MTLKALWELYGNAPTIGTIVVALSILVEVSKIKINPWSRIAKIVKALLQHIGNACNQELYSNIAELKTLIEGVNSDTRESIAFMHDKIKAIDERQAKEYLSAKRRAVLRFADEIRIGVNHSKDMYEIIIADINEYETLCDLSQTPNHLFEESRGLILNSYHQHMVNNDFL